MEINTESEEIWHKAMMIIGGETTRITTEAKSTTMLSKLEMRKNLAKLKRVTSENKQKQTEG